MYVNKRMGCQSIAYAINAMGAKPRRSNTFSRTSVMFILKNNVYIGKIVWDKKTHIRKNSRGNEKHITIYNPKDKWTIKDGLHPAIIDMETWNKAQNIIAQRTHPPSNTGEIKNPLSTLIYCGNCGHLMSRGLSGGMEYYKCLNKGCIKSTQTKYVNVQVMSAIKNNFEDMVIEIAAKANENYVDYSENIKSINKEKKKLNGQMDNLHDLLEQGVYDISTFMSRQKNINTRISELSEQLKIIELKSSKHKHIDSDKMIKKIRTAVDCLEDSTPEEQNELLKTFVDKIIYHKEWSDPSDKCNLEIRIKPYFE